VNIKSVEFAGAIAKKHGKAPGSFPQVAFAGRSNVGKSSLINRLLGRTSTAVARVSSTPGKTREINFFDVIGTSESGKNLRFYLVDLPGYGYAKVSKGKVRQWTELLESYLRGRPTLKRVLVLIDARHGAKDKDEETMRSLDQAAVNYQLVLTKIDKLSASERGALKDKLRARFGGKTPPLALVSGETGEGVDHLWRVIARHCQGESE